MLIIPGRAERRHAVREDLRPGNTFPDFALPDTGGKVVRLSELMGGWPTILIFERGNY